MIHDFNNEFVSTKHNTVGASDILRAEGRMGSNRLTCHAECIRVAGSKYVPFES